MEERAKRIELAMLPLMGDTRFHAFIELIEELKEDAYIYAVGETALKNERVSIAALGESRAYHEILGIYQNYYDKIQNRIDDQDS